MAYVGSKNPGGKLPGWGWAPGLRGYVNSKNPGGPLPGWGWAPNLRGADRHLGSGLRKIVVGGLGCACKEKNLSGLGDDDLVTSVPVPTDPNIYNLYGETVLPAGVGYGPSQSGGVATYPAGSSSFDVSYATPSDLPGGSSSYSAAQIASLLGAGLTTPASAPTANNSTMLWLLGGLAAVFVVAEVSGGKRR